MHNRISLEIIIQFYILIKVTKFDRNLYFVYWKKNYEAYYVINYTMFNVFIYYIIFLI